MVESLPIEQKMYPKTRHSGIDLLRIISILLVCLYHSTQTFHTMYSVTIFSFTGVVIWFLDPFGTIANILFVVCSSFFLVDKSKTRVEKAINILMDSMLISISIFIGFAIAGTRLDWETILHQIFPDIYKMNWFVPCYVIFYLLSPVVVAGLKHLSKKQHFILTVFSLIVYGLLSILSLTPAASSLLSFFYILNIVAFVKWHMPNSSSNRVANIFIFFIGILINSFFYFVFLVLANKNTYFDRFRFISLFSPILVISLIALFNLFKEAKFSNRVISYLSTCSLFVYIIHENYLLRTITRVQYYQWVTSAFGVDLALVYILICGVFMFVVGFVLAVIYKETIGRLTSYLSKKIHLGMTLLIDNIYKKFFENTNKSPLE